MVIALSPLRKVARFSTKPNFSTPGGMKRFSLRISVNTLTPIGLLTVAFMFGVEELAAFDAEALLEHEHRVRRFAEERGAVDAFVLQLLGEERADFVELLPGLGRREVVLVLGLESLLQIVAGEDVLAVVEQEHVAVVGKAVDLAVDRHLVVAIGRRDRLQFVAEAVLVHVGVELLECAGLHEVGHPRGDHVERVVGTGAARDTPA